MVLTYSDEVVKRLIQAIYDESSLDVPDDLEPQDWPTDPVARLTETPETPERLTPIQTEPFALTQEPVQRMDTRRIEQVSAEERAFVQHGKGSPSAARSQKLTTGQFVRKMLAKEGLEYEWGGTTAKGGFDCSGIVWKIMQNAGYTNFPRHSADIYAHSKKISLKKAINTRGALLYREGHMEISLGNGKTIGAGSEGTGVRIGTADQFTHGGLLPELKLGKAVQEASRSRIRQRGGRVRPADPLNKIEGTSSFITAPMVFGSIFAETVNAPRSRREFEANQKSPGLGFAPARLRDYFRQAADRYGVSARLLAAIAKHESGFDPKAVSSAGAQGVMQIMPLHGLDNPFNAKVNILKGAQIFASYLDAADGNLRLALAFYNAGPNADPDVLRERMSVYSDPILALFRGEAA